MYNDANLRVHRIKILILFIIQEEWQGGMYLQQ